MNRFRWLTFRAAHWSSFRAARARPHLSYLSHPSQPSHPSHLPHPPSYGPTSIRAIAYSPNRAQGRDPYLPKRSTLASTKCEFTSSAAAVSVPVYPRCDNTISSRVVRPGARPDDPTAVRNALPHSAFSFPRRKMAFTCSTGRDSSDRFLSLKEIAGTSFV